MPEIPATHIAIGGIVVLGWLCLAAYGIVYCATRAYFVSRNRVIDEVLENQQGDD